VYRKRWVALAVVAMVGLGAPEARADSLCESKAEEAAANAQLKRAEDLESIGKLREAYGAARNTDMDCVSDGRRLEALKKRVAKAVAADAEATGSLDDAFDWYSRAQSWSDAGRMQRKLVDSRPDDVDTVSRAIDFFVQQSDAVQEKAIRAHAAKNVEKALAEEEKQFASAGRDSLQALDRAMNWTYYARTGEDLVRARAASRGDVLAKEDGRKFLELALAYYDRAEKPDEAEKVRSKARGLARRHESEGAGQLAADYYTIAGDDGKADAVRNQTEKRQAAVEETRKKTFQKEQDDLEKELGF
jgi:hypothetical protein